MPFYIFDVITEHHDLQQLLTRNVSRDGTMLNMLCILELSEHLTGFHYLFGRHVVDQEQLVVEASIVEYPSLAVDNIEDLQ